MTRDGSDLTVLRPHRGWPGTGLVELWRRRDLLWSFVLRDVKVQYQQTILGPLWLLIQPAVMTVTLAVVISGFVKLPTNGEPPSLFYMTAMLMWSYFSEVVLSISQVFLTHEYLFSKVYFPRVTVPVAIMISNLIGVALQFGMLLFLAVGLVVFTGAQISLDHLWILPLSFIPLMAFSLGVGLIIASSTAKYRDVANATPFALQSGFLITPILYPFAIVPEAWRPAFAFFNPLSVLSDLWRAALSGSEVVATRTELLLSASSTLLVLGAGLVLFQYFERTAADTI